MSERTPITDIQRVAVAAIMLKGNENPSYQPTDEDFVACGIAVDDPERNARLVELLERVVEEKREADKAAQAQGDTNKGDDESAGPTAEDRKAMRAADKAARSGKTSDAAPAAPTPSKGAGDAKERADNAKAVEKGAELESLRHHSGRKGELAVIYVKVGDANVIVAPDSVKGEHLAL